MSSARAMRRKAQRALLSASLTADQADAMVDAMNNVATARQKAAAEVAPEIVANVPFVLRLVGVQPEEGLLGQATADGGAFRFQPVL